MPRYRGRFAPSPTGPLHAGSLVAALASWLDARAAGGVWLVRMEDVDTGRIMPGADQRILAQLAAFGLTSDEPVVWQSTRFAAYEAALTQLCQSACAYPCTCSRRQILAKLEALGRLPERFHAPVYPGTCRPAPLTSQTLFDKPGVAWRFAIPDGQPVVHWTDRRLGKQEQDVEAEIGDFTVKRSDGLWAYQLAVVVDDAWQEITHVVRGEDLADNTARQIVLQQSLGAPTLSYLHTPLVLDERGDKLSKQTGAPELPMDDLPGRLASAAYALGLQADADSISEILAQLTLQWQDKYPAG
jgi:glutamyl-Q tRNA(Asp) synthetase